MPVTVHEITDAILLKLVSVSAKSGGMAKTIDAYEGSIELLDAGARVLAYPAVLVSYAGSTYITDSAPSFERLLKFSVWHVSTELEGNVIDLVEATRAILNNSSLGLAITPLVIEREFYTELKNGIAVCGAEYVTSTDEEAS